MNEILHQLRCIGCGARIAGAEAQPDFRCAACGELFEVEYPGWSQRGGQDRPNAGALKWVWRERRSSSEALDHSGVWRFRELLPILDNFGNAVTLREGNTPLYHLTRAAKALGIDQLFAKHQGMNPTGSFKDTGMTAAMSVAKERGFEWVACASTGNTSASMAAYAARAGLRSLVLIPEGKIAWGKLSQAMDYGAVTCQLKTDFDGCLRLLSQIVKEAPIYLLNSVNPYRLEGQKTPAFEIAEAFDWSSSRPPDCARRQPGQQFGAGQGLQGDARAGAGGADAAHQRDSGGGGESPGAQLQRASSCRRWSRWRPTPAPQPFASAIRPRGARPRAPFRRPAAGAWT